MGKLVFTPIQKIIFEEFIKHSFPSEFYFTGGTALSAFYFHHRESEDLDFFSEQDFEDEIVIEFINKISKNLNMSYRFTKRDKARICDFTKNEKHIIKIDFVYYPYKRIEKGKIYKNIPIDSLRDIGANKLLTINQRNDVKDFVDLYFLLKKYTIWDLIYAVEAKFKMEMDMILIAADYLKIEDF